MQLLQYDEQTTRTQELNIYVPTSGFDYFYLKFITLVSPFRDDGSAKDVKSLNSWFESLTNRFVIFSSGDFIIRRMVWYEKMSKMCQKDCRLRQNSLKNKCGKNEIEKQVLGRHLVWPYHICFETIFWTYGHTY